MEKILIIYASAGDGHKKAAEAIYEAFLELKDPDINPVIIDSLNYTNRFFKYSYRVGYIFMVRHIPLLWGFFYHMLDFGFFYIINQPLRRLINTFNTKRLIQFLIDENFDAAISTHFLGTEVISYLKGKGIVSLPLVNALTDFKPHRYWQGKNVDYYTVADRTTKDELIRRGVKEDIVRVFGIPIRKNFKVEVSKCQARSHLKLYPDKFTILVMGGGFGIGPIKETVVSLQELDIDCQLIVVCGHNKDLFKQLNRIKEQFKKPTTILGFCANMDEIMSASDIMLSKVGGITTAETLARGLPILTINPIPGQEMANASFLFENNIGFKIKRISDIKEIISELYKSPEKLNELRNKIKSLGRPTAAEDIAKFTIGLIR